MTITLDDIFLLIEYSDSSLPKDLGAKKRVYAEAGIQDYWIADLKNNQLRVFRNIELGDYQTQQILTEGTISPLAFGNVNVDVRRLFS